jgi:HEAT repeat protein
VFPELGHYRTQRALCEEQRKASVRALENVPLPEIDAALQRLDNDRQNRI